MTDKRQRAKAALALTFVGDALSMPVHWFYRQGDILQSFPADGITGFEAAPDTHPGSIMSLHSTGRGGRGSQDSADAVVGRTILKDKAAFWNQRNVHYHHGMPAGENTLNAWCARWMINWLSDRDGNNFSVEDWLQRYVDRMTADPASHPDTYAESYHREFFANYQKGVALLKCGGHTHDTPSMGALVTVAPLAMALLSHGTLADTQSLCREFVFATHPDTGLSAVVDRYVELIHHLLQRSADEDGVATAFEEAATVVAGGNIRRFAHGREAIDKPIRQLVSEDNRVIGGTWSPACYITDSWPGVCHLAARYHRAPQTGLLVNTNLGGENAHRGSVLGCLSGLCSGETTPLYPALRHFTALDREIERWCDRFYPRPASGQADRLSH